jgi:hypothetical protein
MTWEIFTVGNGPVLVSLFTSVKLFTQMGFKSFLTVLALAAFLVASVRAAFNARFDVNPIMILIRTAVAVLVVSAILLTVKTNVAVTDLLNPTSRQEVVTDVPIGVSLPFWVSSQLTYGLTAMVESGFSLPDSSSVLEQGYMWHHALLQRVLMAQLPSGDARQTVATYLLRCVFPNITGPGAPLSLNAIWDSGNLFEAIRVEDVVRTTNIFKDGKILRSAVCLDAYEDTTQDGLTGLFATPFLNQMHPDYAQVVGTLMVEFGLPTEDDLFWSIERAVNTLLGTPLTLPGTIRPGQAILNTVLIHDAWRAAVMEQANMDQNVVLAIEGMIGQMQREMTYQTLLQRTFWAKLTPLLRTIGEGMLIVMTPILLATMMVPIGLTTAATFTQLFVWLTLWTPILAVLNILAYHGAILALRPITGCSDPSVPSQIREVLDYVRRSNGRIMLCQGVTLRTYDDIKERLLYVNGVGAVLAVAAPMLAGALTRGGSHVLSSLVQEGMRAVPDAASYARSAATGKFEIVAYEGPTQLTTWSQATGLWTTTDYQTGERYTLKPNSLIQVEGPYGSYTMDRAHRVVAGTRLVKDEHGAVRQQIEGFGSIQKITESSALGDGTVVKTVQTVALNQDGTSTPIAEDFEAVKKDDKNSYKIQGTVDEQGNGYAQLTGSLEGMSVTGTVQVRNRMPTDGTVTLSGLTSAWIQTADGVRPFTGQGVISIGVKDGQVQPEKSLTRLMVPGGELVGEGLPFGSSPDHPMRMVGSLQELLTHRRPGEKPGEKTTTYLSPQGQKVFSEIERALKGVGYTRQIADPSGRVVLSTTESGRVAHEYGVRIPLPNGNVIVGDRHVSGAGRSAVTTVTNARYVDRSTGQEYYVPNMLLRTGNNGRVEDITFLQGTAGQDLAELHRVTGRGMVLDPATGAVITGQVTRQLNRDGSVNITFGDDAVVTIPQRGNLPERTLSLQSAKFQQQPDGTLKRIALAAQRGEHLQDVMIDERQGVMQIPVQNQDGSTSYEEVFGSAYYNEAGELIAQRAEGGGLRTISMAMGPFQVDLSLNRAGKVLHETWWRGSKVIVDRAITGEQTPISNATLRLLDVPEDPRRWTEEHADTIETYLKRKELLKDTTEIARTASQLVKDALSWKQAFSRKLAPPAEPPKSLFPSPPYKIPRRR